MRYTPSSAFVTFPRPEPENLQPVRDHAESLHTLRAEIMRGEQIGLTELYNNMHDPGSDIAGMAELRASHEKLDTLVASAYGWADLDVGHDFRAVEYLPKKDNLRHTIPESTRLEILRRLTDLNRQRWEEEQKLTADAKGGNSGVSKRKSRKTAARQNSLLTQNQEN